MASPAPPRMRARHWAALAGVTAAGLALRLIGFGHPPPGLWYDEGLNGFNALEVMRGAWPLYFARHGLPEEPFHMYAMAGVMALAGATPFAIRLTSVIAGTLTLPVAFGCFREVFRSNRAALLGAAGLAVMRWHVHFSRIGLRTVWVPLVAAAAIWLALAILRKPRVGHAALLGLVLAFGFYTYLAARLLPFALLALVLWAALHRRRPRGLSRAAVLVAAIFLLGIVPLTIYLLHHPDMLRGRVMDISLFNPPAESSEGPPPAVGQGRRVLGGVGENLLANLWVFTTWGDHVPTHNWPRVPVFDPLTGALFLLGLWVALRGWRRSAGGVALLLWLGVLLLASVLSFGAPNLLRTLGAAPAAMGLVILGVRRAESQVRRRWGARVAMGAVAAWLVWFAAVETLRYRAWGRREDVWEQFNGREYTVASQIAALPATVSVAAFGGWQENDTFAFLTRARTDLIPLPMTPPAPALPTDRPLHVFLLTELTPQRQLLDALRQTAPGARVETLRLPSGRPFATHLIIGERPGA